MDGSGTPEGINQAFSTHGEVSKQLSGGNARSRQMF